MAEAIRLRMNDSSCSANYSISADFTIVVWQKEVVRTNTAQLAVLACGSHSHRPKTSLCLCRNVVKLSHYSGLCTQTEATNAWQAKTEHYASIHLRAASKGSREWC